MAQFLDVNKRFSGWLLELINSQGLLITCLLDPTCHDSLAVLNCSQMWVEQCFFCYPSPFRSVGGMYLLLTYPGCISPQCVCVCVFFPDPQQSWVCCIFQFYAKMCNCGHCMTFAEWLHWGQIQCESCWSNVGKALDLQSVDFDVWESVDLLVCSAWKRVVKSRKLLFSIHSKTGSLDGCWMNHWPIQSEAESTRSKMFNSCLTSWSKSITGIIIILNSHWLV